MKTKHLKERCTNILVQIHRGFLTQEQSATLTDEEVMDNIPNSSLTSKYLENGEQIMVTSPFTYRWVMKRLKRNPATTAYDMLTEAGFTEEGRGA